MAPNDQVLGNPSPCPLRLAFWGRPLHVVWPAHGAPTYVSGSAGAPSEPETTIEDGPSPKRERRGRLGEARCRR